MKRQGTTHFEGHGKIGEVILQYIYYRALKNYFFGNIHNNLALFFSRSLHDQIDFNSFIVWEDCTDNFKLQ